MKGLTEKQSAVLTLVTSAIIRTGIPPTIREIAAGIGVASSCTVQRHLDALEKKGFIKRTRYKYRSVELANPIADYADLRRLLDQAADALAPFARQSEVIGTWNPGEPMPDPGPAPTFLEFNRARLALEAIRALTDRSTP
jgi:repressor LexA